MKPDAFLRASHTILTIVEASTGRQTWPPSNEHFLAPALRGELGRDVQQVIIELGIALDRSIITSQLIRSLKVIDFDLDFRAFRAINTSGVYVDAARLLHDRLSGSEGLLLAARAEFLEIIANIHHLSGNSEEQAVYWRQRVKDFKYTMIHELRAYTQTARTVTDATANGLSMSTSQVMNLLLGAKQKAEAQQTLLIKAKSSVEPFVLQEIESVDKFLLADFLLEAAAVSHSSLFATRLQAMIDRTLPLRTFVDAYDDLSTIAGKEWGGVQENARGFSADIEAVLASSSRMLDEQIHVIDFQQFPGDLNIAHLIELYTETTQKAFDRLQGHVTTWRHAVGKVVDHLEAALHIGV